MKLSAGVVFPLVSLCTACASPQALQQRDLRRQADDFAVCKGQDECALKWQRAADWIEKYSYWKISESTPDVIATLTPQSPYSILPGFRVSRSTGEDGESMIILYAGCLPSVYCYPDTALVSGAFNHYVRTGEDIVIDTQPFGLLRQIDLLAGYASSSVP